MKRKLLGAILIILAIVFTITAVNTVRNTEHRLQLKDVELQERGAELKKLELQYRNLNSELNKTDKSNKDRIDQLEREKQELDEERQRLERELQAKLQRKEQERLAKIERQDTVVNALTLTETVSATPQPVQSGNIESIVRQAAIDNGLDPDWFVRLAMCESTMNPNAVNTSYYENGHPSGLFQHISGYWGARASEHGYAGASVFDPVANANVTAKMWKSGSHLWECQ